MMQTADHELRERIEAVTEAESDADTLLSIAIPPDQSLEAARNRIEADHADAQYSGGGETHHPVRDALERVRRTLREYETTPQQGLLIYAGVIEGELVDYVFDDLPDPVSEWRYVRSNEFDTAPLEAATSPTAAYGLIVVERGEAALGRFVGDEVVPVETVESQVPGKTRAGGQSAERFERKRERKKHEFLEEIADKADRAFLGDTHPADEENADGDDSASGDDPVEGVLVGGSTVTADEFLEEEYLDHRLRDRVIDGSFSIDYAEEEGLYELVERAEDHVLSAEQQAARDALDRFYEGLDDGEEVVYGREETEEALVYEAVETTLVSEELSAEEIGEFEERTDEIGGEWFVISTDFERGEQFDEAFGVGGILRFPIE